MRTKQVSEVLEKLNNMHSADTPAFLRLTQILKTIKGNLEAYLEVADTTDMPWWVVALYDYFYLNFETTSTNDFELDFQEFVNERQRLKKKAKKQVSDYLNFLVDPDAGEHNVLWGGSIYCPEWDDIGMGVVLGGLQQNGLVAWDEKGNLIDVDVESFIDPVEEEPEDSLVDFVRNFKNDPDQVKALADFEEAVKAADPELLTILFGEKKPLSLAERLAFAAEEYFPEPVPDKGKAVLAIEVEDEGRVFVIEYDDGKFVQVQELKGRLYPASLTSDEIDDD